MWISNNLESNQIIFANRTSVFKRIYIINLLMIFYKVFRHNDIDINIVGFKTISLNIILFE